MGRKKKASNVEDQTNAPESTNARAELGSESSNHSADKVDSRDESKTTALKKVESSFLVFSRSSSRKTTGARGNPVRKSQRIQNATLDAQMQDLQRITEEIIASDGDGDDEPVEAEPILEGKSLEQKVEYLLQVSKEHQEILGALKSKKGTAGETSGAGELTYRSLYINSRKEIEALEEENRQLSKKLEHAFGKIEVYEQGNHVPSNVLEKWNGLIFRPSSAKDTAACNVLAEALRGLLTSSEAALEKVPCAKRKRSA